MGEIYLVCHQARPEFRHFATSILGVDEMIRKYYELSDIAEVHISMTGNGNMGSVTIIETDGDEHNFEIEKFTKL